MTGEIMLAVVAGILYLLRAGMEAHALYSMDDWVDKESALVLSLFGGMLWPVITPVRLGFNVHRQIGGGT